MVQLKTESTVDAKTAPFTHQWDSQMRSNYKHFQEEIDLYTYDLQRGLTGIPMLGHWNYPYGVQKTFAYKNLLHQRQLLGKVQEKEIKEFEQAVNSNIRTDLHRTWNTQG